MIIFHPYYPTLTSESESNESVQISTSGISCYTLYPVGIPTPGTRNENYRGTLVPTTTTTI
eukprot:922948-Rhodomonas_salina.1